MKNEIETTPEYANWLQMISRRYRQSQIKAAIAVNSEMLKFYFGLGRDIAMQEKSQPWGSGFLKRLSLDLKMQMPEAECFSITNLKYMRLFFELYAENLFGHQVGDQIAYKENALAAKQISHQVGDQTPPKVGVQNEVVVEVKATEFAPEHLGQLGFYVSAVNHLLKKPEHEPTIGLLACKTKDNTMVKWALEASQHPIGVSEFRIREILPKDVASDLPSIKEIEAELANLEQPSSTTKHQKKAKK